jgi:hypothetical protein
MVTDYDSPWKEALDRYFELFMAFFFPAAHADIDWKRGYEMLDKELQKIVPRPNRAAAWWTSWSRSGSRMARSAGS